MGTPTIDEGRQWSAEQREPLLQPSIEGRLAILEAAEKAEAEDARTNVKGFALAVMAFRSVGVIFGDIGTSPLYIYPSTFDHPPSRGDAMGALCLIVWTLTLVAFLKYVLIVLWANDNGEGGTISLYSLLCREAKIGFEYRTHRSDSLLARISTTRAPRSASQHASLRFKRALEGSSTLKRLLFVVVLLGTCAVIADGILTPGVSVLSAVEGLRVALPSMPQEAVLVISVAILVILFSAQRYGTDAVGAAFAPILLVWLISIAGVGIYNAVKYDLSVFEAVSPVFAVRFFAENGWSGWRMLGGILLCVTGTEALFADLGHFNITAIQLSFSLIALPCVLLQYMGQTAFLIHHPENYNNTFWSAIPQPIFWPLFAVGTLAAIVASQALITGVFSIVNQLMALNCLPPLRVVHTSTSHHGQIFIPEVNYFLMALTIAVVLGFQDSVHLSSAYGVAVTMDMLTTTGLVTLVMIMVWRVPLVAALLFLAFFGTIETAFFSATLLKVPHGGWFPLVIAVALSSVQYIWNWGQRLMAASADNRHVDPEHFFAEGEEQLRMLWSDSPIARVPGVAFFFSGPKPGLPPLLQHFLRNVPALHDVLVLVNVRHVPVSTVLPDERVLVSPLPGFSGLFRAVVRFGYNDLSDLGDGFAQELIWSIYSLCQGEGKLNSSSSHAQLQGSPRRAQAGRRQAPHGSSPSVRFAPTASPRDVLSSRKSSFDWNPSNEVSKSAPDDGAGHPPGSPLVAGVLGANLCRMSAAASLQQRSHSVEAEHDWQHLLRRQSAGAALNQMRLSRKSVQTARALKEAWSLGSTEPQRRHEWRKLDLETEPLSIAISPKRGSGLAHFSPSSWQRDETPNGSAATDVQQTQQPSSSGDNTAESREAARIQHAQMQGVVYVAGRSNVLARRSSSWLRRFILESIFVFLHHNFGGWALAQKIPQDRLIEVGIPAEI